MVKEYQIITKVGRPEMAIAMNKAAHFGWVFETMTVRNGCLLVLMSKEAKDINENAHGPV